jgi:SAM-dependent methyltransferase
MKLNIGCGNTLIDGFINVDNSPSFILSRLPTPMLRLIEKLHLINIYQFEFAKKLKSKKKDFVWGDCLKLPFPAGSVDLCYSSHMIGWCLNSHQLNALLTEIQRVLKPGGHVRLSFFDFDKRVDEFLQHRDTTILLQCMPLASREFYFREKLKFLFSPNMRGGVVMNRDTMVRLLQEHDFRNIQALQAGETTMPPELTGALDLYERSDDSVYVECVKG